MQQLGKADLMLFENSHTNLPYTKNDLFIEMNLDNDHIRNHIHYDATSIIIMRNNKQTRQFVETWLKWCKKESAIIDSPSKTAERVEFLEHRHDQSILSLLLLKHRNIIRFSALPISLKQEYFNHHRRGVVEESLIVLDSR